MTRHPKPGATPTPAADGTAWTLPWLEHLCGCDTTTGHEDRGLPVLTAWLEELGAAVELAEVAEGRHNVFATWGGRDAARLLFSTHLDTVPPFLPPRREQGVLWGRGACDAKGQIAAQFAAIRTLLAAGAGPLAWLGVVGEETDSIGARHALSLGDRLRHCRAIVDGEPTGNTLGLGQRGALHLELRVRGTAAHSGTPERGSSAIWPLLRWLEELRALPAPNDPDLGPEIWNLGVIGGGRAPNVVPDEAEAHLFVRALPGSRFEAEVRARAPAGGTVEVRSSMPPDRYPRVPGFAHCMVPFGSDAPRLRQLAHAGRIALVGPGSIELAHSEQERIADQELEQGHALLVRLAQHFLQEQQ